jgi:hypothetical protein
MCFGGMNDTNNAARQMKAEDEADQQNEREG